VKISLATSKVEKRATKILGDDRYAQTYSRTTDGRRPGTFELAGKHVEVSLKQKAGIKPKSEVVVRIAPPNTPTKLGPEITIDARDAGMFQHVGVVAAEEEGAFVLDLAYMK
jgi:hypothetical protein